jgi:RNA polymerase sigma-70 factor (ECF subfamily)
MSCYATRWSQIQGAARGNVSDREAFARRYEGIVRAYLGARWQRTALTQEVDDAVQEVFLRCFRPGGVLERAEPERPGGFRAFFYGVIRKVALNFERTQARQRVRPADRSSAMDHLPADEDGLSTVFDRAWGEAILREAVAYQGERAKELGSRAQRRVELLHLRFDEDLPIREIAALWEVDPAWLHHEYAKARHEFKEALLEVVAFHHPGTPAEVARECGRLFEAVS